MSEWHMITCEYPPQVGGVSDYSWLVARGLAGEGDDVHVWCPASAQGEPPCSGVNVHRVLHSTKMNSLQKLGKYLDEFQGRRRLLVQWVPHGYGYRSMNLPFCVWLWDRARNSNDELDIIVHEPFLAFGEGTWRQDAAAAIHRIMITIMLHAATRVWVTIPAWEQRLRPYLLDRHIPVKWLPVPSNVECGAVSSNPAETNAAINLGHFGGLNPSTYGMMEPLIPALLAGHSNRSLILIGRDSSKFRANIIKRNPGLAGQVEATGELPPEELSRWIRKCNIMIQPYPDGISSRRGTAMAALCHGVPMVTTKGRLTEEVWERSGAVGLAPAGDMVQFLHTANDLLLSVQKRTEMSVRARRFYGEHFDLSHTIRALRAAHESRPGTSNA